ncbi:MAG: lipopolysaccharide kinase InaA family protein [Bacteroides sp.]|nr:lipopolysaccharide kinase InaA family protein [Bacteroides sp.]
MKFHIHPDYISLEKLIKKIPDGDYKTQETYRNIRNTVSRISLDGEVYVLKKYKVPNFINQVAYSFFRKSKARRSFEYAGKLLKLGITTAQPVAYIEERKNGLFRTSYFLSECLEYPIIGTVDFLYRPENEEIKKDFLIFTAELHERRIIHKDYNPSNIFYFKKGIRYSFALVDINRMSFNKGNLWSYMKTFNQLGVDLRHMYDMIAPYVKARNLNLENCFTIFLLHRKYFSLRNNSKRKFKKHF